MSDLATPPLGKISYSVREIDLAVEADVAELTRLWNVVYPGILKSKLDWLYRNGPAGQARVWLLTGSNGDVAGAAAVFPRWIRVRGERRRAGLAGDFLIHPAHRVLGPALTLQRQVCAEATAGWVDFIYGFPNVAAEPMFRRLGFKVLTQRSRWVVPLKTIQIFTEWAGGGLWAPVAAPIADRAIQLRNFVRGRVAGVRFETVTEIGAAFEDVWQRVSHRYALAIDRDAAYLKWRYLDAPLSEYTLVRAVGADDRLVGYGVSRLVGHYAEVCELVGETPDVVVGLTSELWSHAKDAGVERFEIVLAKGTHAAAAVQEAGYTERPDAHNVLLYVPDNHPDTQLFLDPAQWWLVQSDGDT